MPLKFVHGRMVKPLLNTPTLALWMQFLIHVRYRMLIKIIFDSEWGNSWLITCCTMDIIIRAEFNIHDENSSFSRFVMCCFMGWFNKRCTIMIKCATLESLFYIPLMILSITLFQMLPIFIALPMVHSVSNTTSYEFFFEQLAIW